MKKILSAVLAVVLVLSLAPMSLAYHSEDDIACPVEGGNIYFNKSTGTITDADETVTSANIPATIDGVAVQTIGDDAFASCASLTSVTIPDSVTTIDDNAFYRCSSLTGIAIPDSVTIIGWNAFNGCSSLTSVTIPDGITTLGGGAFGYCTSLTGITIPAGVVLQDWEVEILGWNPVIGCTSLTNIILKDGNPSLSIKDGVLFSIDGKTLLAYPAGKQDKSYSIPDGVTMIGMLSFAFCESLANVTMPDGITTIGDSAFRECISLTSISIPDSVVRIEQSALRISCTVALSCSIVA